MHVSYQVTCSTCVGVDHYLLYNKSLFSVSNFNTLVLLSAKSPRKSCLSIGLTDHCHSIAKNIGRVIGLWFSPRRYLFGSALRAEKLCWVILVIHMYVKLTQHRYTPMNPCRYQWTALEDQVILPLQPLKCLVKVLGFLYVDIRYRGTFDVPVGSGL